MRPIFTGRRVQEDQQVSDVAFLERGPGEVELTSPLIHFPSVPPQGPGEGDGGEIPAATAKSWG